MNICFDVNVFVIVAVCERMFVLMSMSLLLLAVCEGISRLNVHRKLIRCIRNGEGRGGRESGIYNNNNNNNNDKNDDDDNINSNNNNNNNNNSNHFWARYLADKGEHSALT